MKQKILDEKKKHSKELKAEVK